MQGPITAGRSAGARTGRLMEFDVVGEYLVVHPDEECALAWATIEQSPAGGFVVWPHPAWVGGDHVDRWPYWRPDEDAARVAARDMCLDWVGQMPADSGYVIQVCDAEYVLAEEPVETPTA